MTQISFADVEYAGKKKRRRDAKSSWRRWSWSHCPLANFFELPSPVPEEVLGCISGLF